MYILGIKIVFPCQINSYVVLVRTVNNILLNLYSSLITTIFIKYTLFFWVQNVLLFLTDCISEWFCFYS